MDESILTSAFPSVFRAEQVIQNVMKNILAIGDVKDSILNANRQISSFRLTGVPLNHPSHPAQEGSAVIQHQRGMYSTTQSFPCRLLYLPRKHRRPIVENNCLLMPRK